MKKWTLPLGLLSLGLAACDGGSGTSDTTKPVVTLSATQSGTTVTLNATASDASGIRKVEFYRAGKLIYTNDSNSNYTYSFGVTSADNANVTFTAKAYDPSNNVGQADTSLNIYVAPPVTGTLHQGVWGWAIADPTTQNVLDGGASVFSQETSIEGRKVAAGYYLNEAQTKEGIALLGSIGEVNQLAAGFTLGTDGSKLYFVGIDDDNALELYQGQQAFLGSGSIFNAANAPTQPVVVVLIQTSTTVPAGLQAQAAAKVQAKQVAINALKSAKISAFAKTNGLGKVVDGLSQLR